MYNDSANGSLLHSVGTGEIAYVGYSFRAGKV